MASTLFIVAILMVVTMPTITIPTEITTTPCPVDIQSPRTYSLFSMNGVPLETVNTIMIIMAENITECSLNATKVMQNVTLLPYANFVAVMVLACKVPTRVHIEPHTAETVKRIILYLEVSTCQLSITDIDNLARIGETRVFSSASALLFEKTTSSPNITCPGLSNAVSFSLMPAQVNSAELLEMLNCTDIYHDMAEVVFQSDVLNKLPEDIMRKFPNLQTLELLNSNFTEPPRFFPWTTDVFHLPRNISRSRYMHNHYSDAEGLVIPSNVYRRIYNLENNNIRDLSNFSFHGFLHMISLMGNQLTTLGTQTFSHVTGLQKIELANNNLSDLPDGVFQGLVDLRNLDISRNNLSYLQESLFSDLHSLIYLNLANNNLKTLPNKVFSSLLSLQRIQLEYNQLTVVMPDSFPLESISLEEIILHHNPLVTLPELVFWFRQLKLADLHSTNIRFANLTDYLHSMNDIRLLDTVVDSASDSQIDDIFTRAKTLRKIDLKDCKISSISIMPNASKRVKAVLTVLLLHFKFILENNPIYCDCNILPASNLVGELVKNKTVPENEYFFTDWLCASPVELKGRPMLRVKPEETYCNVDIANCPFDCMCFQRAKISRIIVDCRNRNVTELPEVLPKGELELWFTGNFITSLSYRYYFDQTVLIDLSHNRVDSIEGKVFGALSKLEVLYLHSNRISYIPKSIESLHLINVTLKDNPYHCDCNSGWMKSWILQKKKEISNWNLLTCVVNKESGMVIIDVPDEMFKCANEIDAHRIVVIPIATCSVLILIAIVCVAVIYTFRFECKVLIFLYFGLHPFDKYADNAEETIDCVVIHSGAQTDWVMSEVVEKLEKNLYNFAIQDVARDFIVGLSFHENLSNIVQHSKRMIICISQDWNTCSEQFAMTWNIAQEKIKLARANFAIILTHGVPLKETNNKKFKMYTKHGRLIDSSEKMFFDKLLYSMPSKRNNEKNPPIGIGHNDFDNEIHHNDIELDEKQYFQIPQENNHLLNIGLNIPVQDQVFISYSESDLPYITSTLLPLLEQKGIATHIPDRDFEVGASIEENILRAILSSKCTLLILSEAHIKDEWPLYTFRTAHEKSLRENKNRLIVIIRDGYAHDFVDSELQHYVDNYVCLFENDRWFEARLFRSLPRSV